MSKESRIRKIEERIQINQPEPIFLVIRGWNVPDEGRYFDDDNDIERYKEWRMATIREEHRAKGFPVPIMSYCFDTNDVEKHIEAYREIRATSNVHHEPSESKSIEIPKELVDKYNLDK